MLPVGWLVWLLEWCPPWQGAGTWWGQAETQLARATGGVRGLDRPKSPEMGPAEGTPIPPLTHQTEPSDGERGRPQNPTALRGFALTEGGEDDEVQQPCKPCFHHCGRGKERMGEEDARERCPRNVPCLSPSAHSDTDMDGRYSTHSPGFSPPTQWVQHGSGTAQLPFTPWSLRLNSRSHQSPSLPSCLSW